LFGGSLAASAALLSVHKIGNQATHSRIAWLPEEHNLMGIVVFGEMPSFVFSGFFGAKLQKTSRCLQRHRNTAVEAGAVSQLWTRMGERSLLLTHTATTANATLCTRMKS
jgi:hypothetical protein